MRRPLYRYALISLLLTACGGGSPKTTATGPTASATIGTTGGMVASTDGTLQVVIPAGALPSNVTVTVTPTTSPGSGAVGTVFEIGPTGTQFTTPITLTLAYDPAKLNGTDPSMLRVATYASGSWQMLPGAKIDTTAKTVSGTTTHLSPYSLVTAAGGAVCASISGGARCNDSTGPNGTQGTATCTPSTCADATNACAGYPGASMTGCTESANGYTATCCFDPGASICFAAGASPQCAGDGAGPGGGSTGTQTVTCPPPPTCASATAANTCGGYPGATVQNCTNNTSGYTAACCFAPGAPVCVAVGAGAGCLDSAGPSGSTVSCPPPPTCQNSNPCGNTPGTTMTSCTNTTNGYNAVCCYAVGQLPPTGGSGSNGGGTPTSGGVDAGVSSGGSGGSGGGMHTGFDAGQQPPPPGKDGGYIPPPSDGGYVPPPTKDAGGYVPPPPPPDGGYVPPPTKDAGGYVPPPSDGGYVPPPPPPDGGGTQPCQMMTMPPSSSTSPCGVTEFCPSNGNMWSVRCQASGVPCSCIAQGQQVGTVNVSCTPYDPAGMLKACGFPGG